MKSKLKSGDKVRLLPHGGHIAIVRAVLREGKAIEVRIGDSSIWGYRRANVEQLGD